MTTIVASHPDWMSEEALHTLSNGYLVPGETPRAMFQRLASTAAKVNEDPSLEGDVFHCLWEGYIGAASPVASNYGTNRGLPISCFSVHNSDSVSSIYSHLKEVSQLSKNGGGVGVYYGDIRPSGAPISGGGKSTGVAPWAQQFDLCARVVSQGGVRRGSFAHYIPIDHKDVPEILRAKDHSKGDPRNFLDGNIALTISDEWVESMIAGDKQKQELFGEVLKTRMISGSPYLIFIDNANKQNPACYTERGLSVKTSNLCFTGDTLVCVSDGRGAVPIKDLVGTYFQVESACDKGGRWAPTVNKAVAFKTGEREIVEVRLQDGSFFCCTPDHSLATKDCRWVEAQDSVGEELSSGVKVSEVVALSEEEEVFDLTVENDHNFFIQPHCSPKGSEPVLVHNCSEIFLHTDEHHSFVCVLSSLNLSKYDEFKDWRSPVSGRSVPEIAIHLLESVVSEFIRKARDKVGMGRSVRFAEKSRALGLGVMGLHTLYQKRGLPFKSQGARELNIEVHKWVKEEAEKASRELAQKFGEPEWCEGSGMRHTHLLAIAPTKTNSVICGAGSEGIEPIASNYFVAKQAKGTYVRKNPTLERLLCEKGVGEEVWDEILEAKGSVQGLACLTEEEKEIFKTAREIDQFELIKQAADRQPFVCQGQSLNLFVDPEADAEYIMRLHLSAWKMGLKSLYYLKSSSLLTKKKKAPALIITKEGCPWCDRLKQELNFQGVSYRELTKQEAESKGYWNPDWKTVPQLWLYDKHIGGYTDYIQYKQSQETKPEAYAESDKYESCSSCEA